jgi:hypothetical protein
MTGPRRAASSVSTGCRLASLDFVDNNIWTAQLPVINALSAVRFVLSFDHLRDSLSRFIERKSRFACFPLTGLTRPGTFWGQRLRAPRSETFVRKKADLL